MDILTDTEMSNRCTDASLSPHEIWRTDGGMGGHTDVWGTYGYTWGVHMHGYHKADRHTKMPDNTPHAGQLNQLKIGKKYP